MSIPQNVNVQKLYVFQEGRNLNYSFQIAGADPGFSWGGGGAQTIMCAHAHHELEARSPL